MREVLFVLLAVVAAPACAAEKNAVVATVQKLFDAMAAHDRTALQALLTPSGRIYALRPGKLAEVSHAEFIERIGGSKEALLERIWNPVVQVDGSLATLWAPYDFHRAGRLSHCGTDAVTLVETPEGWKVAGIAYTVTEAERCKPGPLGPPRP